MHVMADAAPYSFDWSASPATKSLAKIKRKTAEGWQTTTPKGAEDIGTKYATPGTVEGLPSPEGSEGPDGSPGPENPNVAPSVHMEDNPNVNAPPSTPGGPVVNPNTGTPAFTPKTPEQRAGDIERNWLAQGGSLATLHQSQAAQGMRPRIDARAVASPRDGASPSDAIRGSWGWGTPQPGVSPGNSIWSAMTNQFNNAKQAVQARLNPQPSVANVTPDPVSPSS